MCWLPRLSSLWALLHLRVGSCNLLASTHSAKFNVCMGSSTGTSSAPIVMILRLFDIAVGAIFGFMPTAANGSAGGDQAASVAMPVRARVFLLQYAIDQFAHA